MFVYQDQRRFTRIKKEMKVKQKEDDKTERAYRATRGSAIAEEPRDALRQFKYYGRF